MTDNEIKRIKDSLRTCCTKGVGCKACMYEGADNCRSKLCDSAIGVIEYEQERAEYYEAKCKEITFAKAKITVGKLLPLIDGHVVIQGADGDGLTGDAQTLRSVLNHDMLATAVDAIYLMSGMETCDVALTLHTGGQGGDA